MLTLGMRIGGCDVDKLLLMIHRSIYDRTIFLTHGYDIHGLVL